MPLGLYTRPGLIKPPGLFMTLGLRRLLLGLATLGLLVFAFLGLFSAFLALGVRGPLAPLLLPFGVLRPLELVVMASGLLRPLLFLPLELVVMASGLLRLLLLLPLELVVIASGLRRPLLCLALPLGGLLPRLA